MEVSVAIVDYGLGNLGSLSTSLAKLGVTCNITSDQDVLERSHAVIIPGVGSFDRGINELKQRKLFTFLKELARKGKPILGICLGMQLLFESSEESILSVEGLALIRGEVRRFPKDKISKTPHVGWNYVEFDAPFIECSADYYFVHSYYCNPTDEKVIIGKTEYEQFKFVSSVQKENIFGFQFHPEKSGHIGRKLITHFISYVKETNHSISYRK